MHSRPNADDDSKHLSAEDVDPLGEQGTEVVGRRDRVGSDVGAHVAESPCGGTEEGGGATSLGSLPLVNNVEGLPEDFSIYEQ